MAIINANVNNFNQEVEKGLVLVDFWATWCGPCKMIAPALHELDQELNGQLKVVKVDVDENQELAQQFDVMSIPTLVLMKDGQVVDGTMGFQPKEALAQFVQKHL